MRTTHSLHTLILGSGAAGLSAAIHLKRLGIHDIAILTEGFHAGTSINTGSDKQTYYKLSLCDAAADSPRELADTLFNGGSMHGDLALTEAANSPRAFLNLVNLGVPFPRDSFGQFIGYKTDHDPRQRATSTGPYTSRDMCRALIAEAQRLAIPILENRTAVSLLHHADTILGCLAINADGELETHLAANTIFATGGPGGLYATSVYPTCHTGAIGLALEAGALAQSLPESQYGLASIQFRWNVSGSYMQVIPRLFSTAEDGLTDPQEFLLPYFDTPRTAHDLLFLKGYQWPFDTRKITTQNNHHSAFSIQQSLPGSSLIDILVYIETVLRKRRVFLDYTRNPAHLHLDQLSDEARTYLQNSNALQPTPIERLRHLNAPAIQLYLDHHIDLAREPLEIAVCAQHNNGGLAADAWSRSANLAGLFPIGEVNGSHGVYRPGGSALNAGQVAALRAAEYIAARRANATLPSDAKHIAQARRDEITDWLQRCQIAPVAWQDARRATQLCMSRAGAFIRSPDTTRAALREAREHWQNITWHGLTFATPCMAAEALRTRSLAFAAMVYLDAIVHQIDSRAGSRGSALVLADNGVALHPRLPQWHCEPEDPAFRERVLETLPAPDGAVTHRWVPRRPIPCTDTWFETAWQAFREGLIYDA